jgi:crotonobetainyl-CoA:carnitine CoA-transferase CaiB-like acyl-CoA transferase
VTTEPNRAGEGALPSRPSAGLPLAGIRILAIEQYGAGPFGTMVLADLGADVIKIEPPGGGDIGRRVPPYLATDDSLFFQSLNRGKRSVVLDLKDPRGRELFTRLVARSDAVFSNARGRAPERLKIRYEDLEPYNPAIVCAFLTGFGRSGPRADQPAYDYIVQALTGMASLGGEPDGPPARAGISVVDFSTGLAAAIALLAGVHRARDTGEGGDLDTSLFTTALNLSNYVATWVLSRDFRPTRQPHGAHPSIVPSQLFRASDGWLMVMCQTDAFFGELARRLEMATLASDPRFRTMELRLEHKDELLGLLEPRFRTRTVAQWLERLEGHVPIAPVNDVATALADPQVAALGLIQGYDHEELGHVRFVSGPVQTSSQGPAPTVAPRLGAHTRAVLRELAGADEPLLASLEADGVIEP